MRQQRKSREDTAAAYRMVVEAFAEDREVTREKTKGFGSGALKVRGKIFAMLASKGRFVVKLPEHRVAKLVTSGHGEFFQPGPDRIMKEWCVLEGREESWPTLAKEARTFVAGLPGEK